MSKITSKYQNLPARMRAKSRNGVVRFYYDARSKTGKEIPLGPDYKAALKKHNVLDKEYGGRVRKLPDNVASTLLWSIKKRCARNNMEIKITADDINNMIAESDYRCSVSGIKFNANKYKDVRIRPWFPSVDRIDNKKGYVKGNIRIVCAFVNIALSDFGDDLFYMMVNGAKNWTPMDTKKEVMNPAELE